MIEEIRNGSGPQFLEVHTYRFRGHSMGDPERYRQQEEIRKWQENDPIGIYRNFLISNQITNDDELNSIDNESTAIVDEAVKFAESSPEPTAGDLFKHIYVEAGR